MEAAQVSPPEPASHDARTLAMALPESGIYTDVGRLAGKVGVELAKQGYTVIDIKATTGLLARDAIAPADILSPRALEVLRKDGVDAVVSVDSQPRDLAGRQFQHVEAIVVSTKTTKVIGQIDWRNSFPGLPASPAYFVNRKRASGAGREIAEGLGKLLN